MKIYKRIPRMLYTTEQLHYPHTNKFYRRAAFPILVWTFLIAKNVYFNGI